MKKQSKYRLGFTLAEIVIAVAIIGSISALTIQTYLVNSNSQKAQYVAALKKVYAELSFATQQIKANNSGTIERSWDDSGGIGDDNLRNLYSRYLKITQLCDMNAPSENCWPTDYFQFDGSANNFNLDSHSKAVLNDGTLLAFGNGQAACGGGDVAGGSCAQLMIDVNGFKPPNRFGKDIFLFYISKNGLVPNGDILTGFEDTCPNAAGPYPAGTTCAAKVLKEGNMAY